ncbi:50S ribosomal protein L9 [bacterium]|nr:50S ribosomal protein L9 [bacterium]
MNVILLEKVGRLGDIGDLVTVKRGFGRNYLLPQGKAQPATKSNVADFESRRSELQAAANERQQQAQTRADSLANAVVEIPANAGDEGKLFGSIGARDIAEALTGAGYKVEKSEVKLPDGVLRDIGEYMVNIQVHSEIIQPVSIKVIPE